MFAGSSCIYLSVYICQAYEKTGIIIIIIYSLYTREGLGSREQPNGRMMAGGDLKGEGDGGSFSSLDFKMPIKAAKGSLFIFLVKKITLLGEKKVFTIFYSATVRLIKFHTVCRSSPVE